MAELMDKLNVTATNEPIWSLERRDSSGQLFWKSDSSKIRFRCDVDLFEYEKDPDEHKIEYENRNTNQTITGAVIACAAIAVSVLIPWFLFGPS